jgi:hypothetical protein
MSLLSTLIGSMSSDDSVNAVSKKTGVSKLAIGGLIAIALPILIKKLTSNAQSQQGAASLLGALSQHTDTDSLANQISNADAEDGSAIIGHILGSDQADTISQIAAQSNLSEEQVNSVLDNIAPALMSSLSAANTENIQQQAEAAAEKPAGGLASILSLGGLLGGSSSSASSGGGLLSSLFGGGKNDEAAVDGTSLLTLLMNSGK